MFRLLHLSLLVASVLALSAGPGFSQEQNPPNAPAETGEPQTAPPIPEEWRTFDTSFRRERFSVEISRFPSRALAESVRSGMANLGWQPVTVEAIGSDYRVLLGNTGSIAEAVFVQKELITQDIASPRIVRLGVDTEIPPEPVDGPFLEPFLPTPQAGKAPLTLDQVADRLRSFIREVSITEGTEAERNTETLLSETDVHQRGPAAAYLAVQMHDERLYPEAVLFLASKVARSEWPADRQPTIQCREIVAELLREHRRDWRGAWSATEALLGDPARDGAGRARDRMRQAALHVDLVAGSGETVPQWPEVRGLLWRAYATAPENERQLLAKIELVYMQTFAWEGDWDRVEPLARSLIRRYPAQRTETSYARVFLARSLERERNWDDAIAQLDIVLQMQLPLEESLFMGYKPLDIKEMAREYRRSFVSLAAGAE